MKHRDESGFAMLLVFVMAAAISITLYMEVPRIAFESQRAKEQMAIDRGLQYKRAIQLFYRKYQLYPQTLDDLETARNIRFLRRRYLDPLTGKEWRLLHVGPGGQLTDSLVQPPAPLPGSSTGSGPNSAPGSQQTGGFGQSSNSAPAPNATQPVDPNNPNDPNAQAPDPLNMAARRPSDRIIGRGGGVLLMEPTPEPVVEQPPPPEPEPEQPQQPAPVETPQEPADPNAPEEPAQPENPAQPQAPQQPIPGLPAGAQPPGQPPGQPPVLFPPLAPTPGGSPGQTPPASTPFPQQGQQAGQQFTGQAGAPGNGGQPQSAANMIQNILTTPRQPPSSLNFTTGNTGGIAGVASTAEGKGIHVVNDHAKYKEWEFVYDLKKDKSVVGAAGAIQQQQMQQLMQQNQNGANGPFGSSGSTLSPFGSTPGSSPSGSNSAAPAVPTTAPPSQ